MCFGENIVQVREFWFSYFSSQRKLFWCDAFNDSNPDTDPDPDDNHNHIVQLDSLTISKQVINYHFMNI